ncbi:MFS transporter [Jeongeupia sp. HS-3]|uniref:multidrug transporter subunit MdtD n=1 Tax=Jeongeupia sp. HS-3 TaxID=1009682 RepID=UPI0018A40F59|nr:multidrug transporter subunit MdtD [Jeongeupia sp. HS-3]BCL75694.1 MFS transporter [Jeongeupia sp. HS-3]
MSESRENRWLLWLVAIGFFMQTLDSTIVNTALPSMAINMGESPLRMQSVVISYMLTVALLMPASGWLADRFGTRRVYLAAIILFTLGSLACAQSQSLWQLVVARVIQGIGGAMLLPIGRLAVLRAFPRAQFLAAMSFVTIPGLVGPLIGPTLGGWLVVYASWHWIFLINIPIGIVGAIATARFMPAFFGAERQRFDIHGYLLLAFAMVTISVSLDGLAELGLKTVVVTLLLVAGLAAICVYVLHAGRSERPLFSLSLFHVRTYTIGVWGNLFARIGAGAVPFLIPLMLQISLGFSPLEAGLMMLPTAIAGLAAKSWVSPLIRRFGYRQVLVVNTFLTGLMIMSFALFSPQEPLWLRIVQLAVFGAVNSIQFTAMNTLALKDLETSQASEGNGLLSMIMQLSMSLGVAAAGAMLGAFSDYFGRAEAGTALQAFQVTFACVGVITAISAWIFWQLDPNDRECSEAGPTELE